jgi:PIN domain nuclease of toxin-antitoxin system
VDVVLDASAAIALLLDEVTAGAIETLLAHASPRMSTINVAEAVDVLVRVHRGDPDEVVTQVDVLLSTVAPVAATPGIATRAGELRARHWRRDQRISLADCFVIATAEAGALIATLDGTLANVARAEGYEVVPLD